MIYIVTCTVMTEFVRLLAVKRCRNEQHLGGQRLAPVAAGVGFLDVNR